MFVTCHINFWPLSSFVRVSFEVTRTIRNNKQHFTRGCSILLLKKGKGPWKRISFFFFTSLVVHYSQNVFSWFFYLGVHRGTGVFSLLFLLNFSLLLSHVTRSRARLALASVVLKNCTCSADPILLNETKGSWFPLSCLPSYQNGR